MLGPASPRQPLHARLLALGSDTPADGGASGGRTGGEFGCIFVLVC